MDDNIYNWWIWIVPFILHWYKKRLNLVVVFVHFRFWTLLQPKRIGLLWYMWGVCHPISPFTKPMRGLDYWEWLITPRGQSLVAHYVTSYWQLRWEIDWKRFFLSDCILVKSVWYKHMTIENMWNWSFNENKGNQLFHPDNWDDLILSKCIWLSPS